MPFVKITENLRPVADQRVQCLSILEIVSLGQTGTVVSETLFQITKDNFVRERLAKAITGPLGLSEGFVRREDDVLGQSPLGEKAVSAS